MPGLYSSACPLSPSQITQTLKGQHWTHAELIKALSCLENLQCYTYCSLSGHTTSVLPYPHNKNSIMLETLSCQKLSTSIFGRSFIFSLCKPVKILALSCQWSLIFLIQLNKLRPLFLSSQEECSILHSFLVAICWTHSS